MHCILVRHTCCHSEKPSLAGFGLSPKTEKPGKNYVSVVLTLALKQLRLHYSFGLKSHSLVYLFAIDLLNKQIDEETPTKGLPKRVFSFFLYDESGRRSIYGPIRWSET